jgi:hypothetical protein
VEKEIRKSISFTIASKKNLGINSTKEVKPIQPWRKKFKETP